MSDKNEMTPQGMLVRTIINQIGLLDVDELEELLKQQKESRQQFENTGWFVDPTKYRDYMQGDGEQLDLLEQMITKLIEVKRLGEKHDAIVKRRFTR